MRRRIVGFQQDDVGDWVARLECLHRQHVRHQPPFRPNPWVMVEAERDGRVGTTLNCPLCDRCELPVDLTVRRTTPTWTERTVPDALRRHHRVAAGCWGRLAVEAGSVRFLARTDPETDVVVVAGAVQAIPPEVDHHLQIDGPVRLAIDFLGPGP